MVLGPLIPFLAVALILSVTGMVHGAGRADAQFTALSAQAFVALVVIVALVLNVSSWRDASLEDNVEKSASAVRRNGRLAALIYAWGAAAMFAMYSLSELSWRHSWQYGLGMAVLGIGITIYIYWLRAKAKPIFPPLSLTLLHAGAAAAGLTFLIGTGKLNTVKSDWAANEVFLWGGLAIIVLCVLSVITQLRGKKN